MLLFPVASNGKVAERNIDLFFADVAVSVVHVEAACDHDVHDARQSVLIDVGVTCHVNLATRVSRVATPIQDT